MSNSQSQHDGLPQSATVSYHPDPMQGPARKKMRKGTKSCLECRRRKIKCTFEPGRPQICNECHTRGSACIDQEHGDIQVYGQQTADQSSQSLRERVSALEGLVKQVLDKLPDGQAASSSSSPSVDGNRIDAQAAEVLKSLKTSKTATSLLLTDDDFLPGGVRGDAPTLTLFNNAVIQRKESEPTLSREQYNKNRTLIAVLTQMLPSAHDLSIILESSHEWWVIWRKMFPEITDRRCESMKESVSHSLRSDKPAEIAKIILCIAISLHQMPDGFDWSRLHLTESRSQLMDKYISAVDKLIISDDEVAATIEGIECMVLASKYHINMGRPRRSWLLYHRAIAFCQLLGFHRLLSQPDYSNSEFRRSISIWTHLIMGDRVLALLLGIPYTVPDPFCRPLFASAMMQQFSANDGEIYIFKLLPLITRMVDRNQSPVSVPYSATMRLDQELEELHASQDPSWWTTERLPYQAVEDHFDRLQAQMFHYQAKVLLHMPFMLRSSANDKRYHYSHSSALDGARHMIRYYDSLRTSPIGPYICKLIDFQAFTAAMLLLLNLCGYASANRTSQQHPQDLEQDQHDSELIDLTIALLQDASKELGGAVAAQSVQALELLAQVRQGSDGKASKECQKQTCQVSIPYFGTISITMGKSFVPIKPGTYPKPGEAKISKAAGLPVGTGTMNLSGLPTPPSIASCSSAQQSPMPSKNLDSHAANIQPQPQYDTSNFMASTLDQSWNGDIDPFITFDAFMTLPQQNLPIDFPTTGSTGGIGTGAENQHSFPFGGLPFNQGNNSGVDLDQGWNWFGVDAPIIP
ncbi:hypothetical protein DV736_g4733, partial [Chaetothyriales sp. CBS 134916]